MLYSIKKYCPRVVINLASLLFAATKPVGFFTFGLAATTVFTVVVFATNSPAAAAGGPAPAAVELATEDAAAAIETDNKNPAFHFQPHQAVYSGNFSGLNANMTQSLTRLGNQQWQLHNSASILFVGFEETAQFTRAGDEIIADHYQYINKVSKKRSSSLQFNHHNHTVTDSKKEQKPMAIPARALDKISLEFQLRLDLINSGNQFRDKVYDVVSLGKIRHYKIKYLGEEEITVPAGSFKTLKLEQRRVGSDNKSTLLWFAPALDYLLVNIRRIETDKPDINITLKSVKFNP